MKSANVSAGYTTVVTNYMVNSLSERGGSLSIVVGVGTATVQAMIVEVMIGACSLETLVCITAIVLVATVDVAVEKKVHLEVEQPQY